MPSTLSVPKDRASYTVAFICALELEMSAVRCMLDVHHPNLPPQADDSNLYILGELSCYNVVLAWLSGYQGKGAAGIVATNLSRSFPAIEWRFLVGIGGGVPSHRHDIRLGDVVISMPEGRYGGVVQYDLGKYEEEGFQLKGHLLAPPTQLRNAVVLMRSNHSIEGNKVEEFLSQMLQKFPRLSRYRRPNDEDVLFAVDCPHDRNHPTCGHCDRKKIISREPREFEGPEIHYGLIASGDLVMKSAAQRQATAQSLGDVLCFDMEAAGIATEYSCVIIRGVSDYADAHKNDHWQCYAAAAAAAAAKELLSCIPVGGPGHTRQIDPSTEPLAIQRGLVTGVRQVALQQSKDCAKSLAFAKMNDRTNDLSIKAAEGTCRWLLRHRVCANWSTQDRALLWIKGKPGSGKSTLMRWFLDEKRKEKVYAGNKSLILSFFFHGRGVELERTPLGLFRSLLHQLLSQVPETEPDLVRTFQQRCDTMGEAGKDWDWQLRELQEAFRSAISNILERQTVWLFVDALDECGKPDAIELIRHFKDLLTSLSPKNRKFFICVTCRHYPILNLGSAHEITLESENEGDIAVYVRERLSPLDTSDASSLTHLITTQADGIFLWASLTVERVLELDLGGVSVARIQAEIRSTPPGLFSLYLELVRNMSEKPKSLKLIQWLCFAARPLSLDELRWVLAIDADHTSPVKSLKQARKSDDYIKNSVRMERRLKTLSCGLVEAAVSSNQRVARFIHQSVRDFFIEKGISALDDSVAVSENDTKYIVGMAHYQISRTCIRYMTMKEIILPTAPGEEFAHRFPLLDYATKLWMEHTKTSEQNGIPQNDLLIYFDWPRGLFQRWLAVLCHTNVYFRFFPPAMTSMLHMLSQHHLITPLKLLLSPANEIDVNVNERDNEGYPPLLRAALNGHVAVVELLLDTIGIEINRRDFEGRTPLLCAALNGHVAIVALLLNKDHIDINGRDDRGQTPLLCAALGGHVAVVELLLDKDPININGRDDEGQTPLLCAALGGHVAVVELLLDKDPININGRDDEGRTPLLCAAFWGNAAVAELLLAMDHVDINARDASKYTALLYAACYDYQSITELLLATEKADTDAENDSGRTPLSYGAENGHITAVKFYITGNKERIDLKDTEGKTPLWYAAHAGQRQAAELLIHEGADVSAASNGGEGTPLHAAARHGHTDVVRLLIENQANVGAAADNGITPLHEASSQGRADAIKLLIKNQADVGAVDIFGRTPLHLAICSDDTESVKLLLGAGADPHAADKKGETALQLAQERARLKVRPANRACLHFIEQLSVVGQLRFKPIDI